jgi:hypothetical protein
VRVLRAEPSKYKLHRLAPTKRRLALSELHTEQTIKARQITDAHANRSSQGFNESGKFFYHPVLDNGYEGSLLPRWA